MKPNHFTVFLLLSLAWKMAFATPPSGAQIQKVTDPAPGWTVEKISETVFTSDWNASLALDSSSNPQVTYSDSDFAPDYRLKYAQRSGSVWSEEVLGTGSYVGLPSSLAIGTDGVIHIGYGAEDRVLYARRDSSWTFDQVESVSEQWYQDISLALDSANQPHLSYYNWDSKEVWYAYLNSSNAWERILVADNASFAAALAWGNGPHIVYQDGNGIQYAHRGLLNWERSTVSTSGSIGRHALALTPDGRPCVLFTVSNDPSPPNNGLFFACGGDWTRWKVSDSRGGGSLGITAGGQPHVIYQDSGLQYATPLGLKWISRPLGISGTFPSNQVYHAAGGKEICFLYIAQNGDLMLACGSGLIETDLVADALEVTQAVQDLKNSVPLVAEKRTAVRFHVHSSDLTVAATARLKVTGSAGTAFLIPKNFYVHVRPKPDRGKWFHSFNFELPKEYTRGTVTLEAEINPELNLSRPMPETNTQNNKASATVTFEPVPPVFVSFYNVTYENAGQKFSSTEGPQYIRNFLRRAFPLSGLRYRESSHDYGTGTPDCRALNHFLAQQRAWDGLYFWQGIPNNARYYATFDNRGLNMEYPHERGCPGGIPGYTAAGPEFEDDSYPYVDPLGGHWLGNAYGRRDVSGSSVNFDSHYPFPEGRISRGGVGEDAFYGFDVFTRLVYPWNAQDVMSYKPNWISQYTTEGLLRFFKQAARSTRAGGSLAAPADRLFVNGSIDSGTGQADLGPLYLLPGVEDLIPRVPGDYAVVLRGKMGNELARYPFTPSVSYLGNGSEVLFFTELVPYAAGTDRADLEGPGGIVLAFVQAGSAFPTVTLLSPNGGEVFTGTSIPVSWTAGDTDGDPLSFSLQYSPDNGASWMLVASNVTATTVNVDAGNLVASTRALFRVWATDGIHTGSDTSNAPFTIPNRPPTVQIVSPEPGLIMAAGQTLSLEAEAYDPDLGSLDGAQVQWSSTLQGSLGNGTQRSLTGLNPGNHTITVRADDGQGGVASDSVSITVVADGTQLPFPSDGLLVGPSKIIFFPREGLIEGRLSIDSQNLLRSLRWNAAVSHPWITLSTASGTTPMDDLGVTFQDTGLPFGLSKAQIIVTSPDLPGQSVAIEVLVDRPGYYLYLPLVQR